MDSRPDAASSWAVLWGVGAVSSRLGIAAPTLRTWDRRYGLGPSHRTEGGHRRYTEVDVARVALMSRLVDEGVAAAEAAMVALTHETDALPAARPLSPASAPERAAAGSVAKLVAAAVSLDAATLSRVTSAVFARHGVVGGWTKVAVPALVEIGRRWAGGELGVESEHLISERLSAELRAITRARRVHRAVATSVLMAGAAGEQHYLPVIALEAALAERRIPTMALGPRTPSAALEAAVVRRDPRVVFIWRSMAHADEEQPSLVNGSLRHRPVLLGGPGWQEPADRSNVVHVADLARAVELISDLLRG